MSRFYELLNKNGQTGAARAFAVAEARDYRLDRAQAIAPLALSAELEGEMTKLVRRVFLAGEESPRSVMFVPVSRSEDASLFCAAAAQVLSLQARASVCVADLDVASPSIAPRFGIAHEENLSAMTGERGSRDLVLHAIPATDLSVLTLAVPDGATRLQPLALAQQVTELRGQFEYVIALAPTFANTQVVSLGGLFLGVIAVIEAHSTRKDLARAFKQELKDANIPLLGAILNNRTSSARELQYLHY